MPKAKVRIVSLPQDSREEIEYEISPSSSSSYTSGTSDSDNEVVVAEIANEKNDNATAAAAAVGDDNVVVSLDAAVPDAAAGGGAKMGIIVEEGEGEERDEDSNIADVRPTIGMNVEIRDPDFIWSSAKIVNVEKENNGSDSDSDSDDDDDEDDEELSALNIKSVTVRYDGWGCQWDETIPWPSCRLAKLFTYTKRVKCLVDMMPRGRARGPGSQHRSLWPCSVSFRMPHPNSVTIARSEEFLRLEVNVFVAPYGQHLLPAHIRKSLANGGRWINHSRLRRWRDDVNDLFSLHKGFMDAHKMACEDSSTRGTLPVKALEVGTLLSAPYRVRKVGGEPVSGLMYTGECPPPRPPAPKKKPLVSRRDMGLSSNFNESSSDRMRDLTNLCDSNEEDKEEVYQPPKYEPPPTCPPPIRITEPVYPTGGVVRFEKTKRWGASVSLNGNEVFLGSFPTQTQAADAIQAALNPSRCPSEVSGGSHNGQREAVKHEEDEAHRKDLNVVSLESSMAALERQDMNQPNSGITLHDWTMQLIRHKEYVIEECEKRRAFKERRRKRAAAAGEEAPSLCQDSVGAERNGDTATFSKCGEIVARKIATLRRSSESSSSTSKRRKISHPQRLDLEKLPPHEYIM
mmetsp:Transcript_15659/g.21445  ORF Transcript_15659/g.21445 Transcript_15659/m.21445 type:complete len:629 (-) Transcript_15659:205-2091(-)|eukprot:CAMPEP_0185736846 /NCGR_PEP_ID=MMETSP1171-20130828/28922_1 /TAXON_ID=374046 /ORGANISM="Helicotheca tamensis, Strain CCMP826" /LENGTH=628 /DNA_ID=CAMNT_0028407591 /DNA_START=148 /DNA_END=2034 /DNA_ORIENTATION=-